MKEELHKAIDVGDGKYVLAWDIRCKVCKRGIKHPPNEVGLKDIPLIEPMPPTNKLEDGIIERFVRKFCIPTIRGVGLDPEHFDEPENRKRNTKIINFLKEELPKLKSEIGRELLEKVYKSVDEAIVAINEDARLVIRDPAGEIIKKIIENNLTK